MIKTSFTLIGKKNLTADVYELIYRADDLVAAKPQPGQYVMFQLAPGLNRSYSFANFDLGGEYPTFTLIIKRVEAGRGSPDICEAPIGTEFSGMLPLGHFTLQDTAKNKCFIGTGTGFAPLFCQLANIQQTDIAVAFIFGVRFFGDFFYDRELHRALHRCSRSTSVQFFSQETALEQFSGKATPRTGYVTDWITADNIAEYEEFYLCGSPAMVKSAREKLGELGVTKEQIFWEQF